MGSLLSRMQRNVAPAHQGIVVIFIDGDGKRAPVTCFAQELLIDVLVTGSSFLNRDWKSARFLLNGGEELNKDSKEVTIGDQGISLFDEISVLLDGEETDWVDCYKVLSHNS